MRRSFQSAVGSRQSAGGRTSPGTLIPNPQSLIPPRSAFTLVELLVVVVIIGMLAGLLLPAVISAREAARRAQCANNQKQLATAILQYEGAKQRLPGFANQLTGPTGTPVAVSWIPVLFPYLGRNDLWEGANGAPGWRNGALKNEPGLPRNDAFEPRIGELVCPDDATTQKCALSYVVNVGWCFPGDHYNKFPTITNVDGLFRRLIPGMGTGTGTDPSVALSDVRSPSRRPMISERADAPPTTNLTDQYPRQWSSRASASGAGGTFTRSDLANALPTQDGLRVPLIDLELGFQWPIDKNLPDGQKLLGNRLYLDKGVLPPNHPGVVIVTFCDGHTEQLSDDTDCTTYDNDVSTLPQ
jgi:prepilin-type N-terminal cleavage/methylation domain-containing protein/prepilin-type processing-associated H-X9-DG protein